MKFAKIKDGKIIKIINGLSPNGFVPAIKKWELPDNYPGYFYSPESTEPTFTVVGKEVHENWQFKLKEVDMIKPAIYGILSKMRNKKELESFDVDGENVKLKNKASYTHIAGLSETSGAYKISNGYWLETVGKVKILKIKASKHLQDKFDWELSQYKLVKALNTHDELKNYLLILGQ